MRYRQKVHWPSELDGWPKCREIRDEDDTFTSDRLEEITCRKCIRMLESELSKKPSDKSGWNIADFRPWDSE